MQMKISSFLLKEPEFEDQEEQSDVNANTGLYSVLPRDQAAFDNLIVILKAQAKRGFEPGGFNRLLRDRHLCSTYLKYKEVVREQVPGVRSRRNVFQQF
ncbi:hypothetical protein V866_001902 [Kwoniella sp. B9012]